MPSAEGEAQPGQDEEVITRLKHTLVTTRGLAHLRLPGSWTDDPADPAPMSVNGPNVQQLVTAISPESHVTDLGDVSNLGDPLAQVLHPVVAGARRFLEVPRGEACSLPVRLRHWDHLSEFLSGQSGGPAPGPTL